MDTIQIVTGVITAAVSLLCGIYACFAARGKGPILSNTYLWATPEERKRLDLHAEYRLVAVVFAGLGAAFGFLSAYIFLHVGWARIAVWIAAAFVVCYAVFESIKTERQKRP